MWGVYVGKTRAEIYSEDLLGGKLMTNDFFHPYLTYNARIDKGFKGIFSLKYDSLKPYTNHSQYLKDITLLGDNDVSVSINQLDNNITGNNGKNTVLFTGNRSEYIVKASKNITYVTDRYLERDGANVLEKIEILRFNDETLLLKE